MKSKTKTFTFCWGRCGGFNLGICINKYMASLDLIFFYVAVEY